MATPRLKVTYKDLQRRVQMNKDKLAAENSKDAQDMHNERIDVAPVSRQDKRSRRPDQVIYRPGQRRQGKGQSTEEGKPTTTDRQQTSNQQISNQTQPPAKAPQRPQNDFGDLMVDSGLKTTPPGRKFGPRGRQAASLAANAPTKKITPESSPSAGSKSKNGDSEEELLLDADAMVAEAKNHTTAQDTNVYSYNNRPKKNDHRGQHGGDVQSRVFSRSKNHQREQRVIPDEEVTVEKEAAMKPQEGGSVHNDTDELKDDVEDGETWKAHLGGNTKITCRFNTSSLPATEGLESEGPNVAHESNRPKGSQPGRGGDKSKGPRGKLHTLLKAREKYDSGSSTGNDKLENFGRFASESDNWDPEMERADYQLQTMVISSRTRSGKGRQEDGLEREEEQQLRRPRIPKFETPEVGEEEFYWDEDLIDPKKHNGDKEGRNARQGRVGERNAESKVRHERRPPSREDKMQGKEPEYRTKPVKGRGPVRSRLRQDSESSEEAWSTPFRKGDSRVARLRRESGNSRSSDDYDSDRHEERHTKGGGGILHLGGRSSPKAIPENSTTRGHREVTHKKNSPGRAQSPARSPKPKDKQKDSRLWDPSKPNQRPALEQKPPSTQLVFLDSDSETQNSPADRGSYEYGTSYQGYDPSAYPPVQYQGYQQNSTQSWADQTESSYGYPPTAMQPPSQSVPYGYYNTPAQSMNFDPQQIALMHGKRAKEQAAMQVVLEAANKETDFSNAVVQGIHSKENLQIVLSIRKDLEKLYEGIVLLDLQISTQYNIEQLLWKNAYYQLCELMKKEEYAKDTTYKDAMVELLQNGSTFYEELLEKLQSTYCFKLDTKTGLDPLHEEPRRTIKLAILSAQRCMIALGDIARYKEQAHGTSSYGRARSWYTKAQRLAPRNGKPYNQLAILALYTRRKLDAVYFYMRSLAASNPFITARESLMTLFEEVRKKIEHKEQEVLRLKKEKESRLNQPPQRRGQRGGDDGGNRKEIWIHYDGTRAGAKPHDMEEEEQLSDEESSERELKKMPPAELNKRFVLSFLNVHGKLFTKIGMEAFSHAVGNLLKEFSALLSQTPTPITSNRLLQLMAINMFAVENTNVKDERTASDDLRPYLQELSVQLGLDMFIILVQRCSEYLKNLQKQTRPDQCLCEDLHEMLPAVKVFADWMMCHPGLWNPPPTVNEEHLVSKTDVWETVASFLNILKDYEEFGVDFMPECEDSEEILLPEDHMLSGFVPLLALPLKPLYVSKNVDKMLAMDSIRITSLKLFGEFIYGQETPLIAFDGARGCYVSVAPKMVAGSVQRLHRRLDQGAHLEGHGNDDDDDEMLESHMEDGATNGEFEDNHVSHLRERRNSLEKLLLEQKQKQAQRQEVIERQRTQRDLVIEINARYLIPDTNCFIDHLPAIEELVACQRYLVIVPLVVINELDGLSHGLRNEGAGVSTAQNVAAFAADAIEFLERSFDERNKHLKAMTSQGTRLDTIAYRSEESKRIGNNDDLILKCCLHYCNDKARDYMPANKDAPITLYREITLLTNDRNLRVKAIQQNVPTSEVLAFLRWAKR
ncbi:telomerase-binding protein EST1A-like isoform X2 [Apostichopus japonicus]|uniref:telomerase-binding protein EST1A-like isoform X2 n=1 Tax=Stichopus japonicus TaxID=307972 RepID=UPI003AB44E59